LIYCSKNQTYIVVMRCRKEHVLSAPQLPYNWR